MKNTKVDYLKLLKAHKDSVTTVKKWDEYAKANGLPSSSTLIHEFGTWNNLKKELGLNVYETNYSLDELNEIAQKYKIHFVSKAEWDNFSKENRLPSSGTYIKHFKTWNNLKKHLGIKNNGKKSTYTKEQIIKILNEHAEHYENRTQWDKYAKEHKLPTYKTIRTYLSYEEMTKALHKEKITQNDLLEIAFKHRDIFLFTSMTKWDNYAKAHKLPSSFIFYKQFGSWKKAKGEAIKYIISKAIQ